MFRRIGMSLLLSWICLNAYAQLPHPNDTLENGKKVPFNQFLGRFSVFNDLGGAAFYYSLNVGYSFIKTDLITTDFTIGANRIQYGKYHWKEGVVNSFFIPIGISAYFGRRSSRFNMRLGYSPQVYSELLSTNKQGNCFDCYPIEHKFFLSLGYTYQNPSGFFLGVNANLLLSVWSADQQEFYPGKVGYQPWPGLVLGYHLPSKQQHREWTERSFKKRVLRLEQPEERKNRKAEDEFDEAFYNDKPLEVDSNDTHEIKAQLAKLKKRHDRYLKEEQRLNGRSHVFVEGFGAAGLWSVNYSYSHPIAKSKTWMMEYGAGFGSDRYNFGIPVFAGVKATKNYRGTGVFIGVMPQLDLDGKSAMIYFLKHNVEFHFAYGLTGGVAFYMFYDPQEFKYSGQWSPYGGFFLGYRLPQLKK